MEVSDSSRSRAGAEVGINTGEAVAATPRLSHRAALFAGIAAVGAALDLWTKQAVFAWRGLPGERDAWWILDGVFGIETAVNPGAVFGVGAGKGMLFAGFSVVAAVGILVWLFWFRGARSLWLTWALGLVTGGILGNLYDRLGMWWQPHLPQPWRSGVRDWILFRIEGVPLFDPWPNFNIADSLLVVGAGMLMYQSLVLEGKQDRLPDEAGEGASAGE